MRGRENIKKSKPQNEHNEHPKASTSARVTCPNCDRKLPEDGICIECGWHGSGVAESQLTPWDIEETLADKYEISQLLPTVYSRMNKYIAWDLDNGQNVLIKEGESIHASEGHEASLQPHSLSRSPPRESGVQTEFTIARVTHLLEDGSDQETEGYRPNPHLEFEYRILEEVRYPTIVKALDRFVVEDRTYLVEEYVDGQTLREAWQAAGNDPIQQVDWLIQLCQALSKLHTSGVLYNAIDPDMLIVSKDNRVVLNEFGWAEILPLTTDYEAKDDYYTAPELVLTPEMADIRADLYSLGATWLSLLLGRPLSHEDFEGLFLPKLPIEVHTDLHPEINRILMKAFNRDMEQRFAKSGEIVNDEKFPTQELQNDLLQIKNEFSDWNLSVGKRTSVGIARETNEDDYWTGVISTRNTGSHVNCGIFVVSDGVGGAMAGEVASQITVRTISSVLGPKLLVEDVAQTEQYENIIPAIDDAIKSANEEVNSYARHTLGLPVGKMGCTVTVAVLTENGIYVGHIGDSKLYLIQDGVCYQQTRDHVDATSSALKKAIGRDASVEPDTFTFQLEKGDKLLLCSDGLTDYAGMNAIEEVIQKNSGPQHACDKLVNLANAGGGGDNITIVIVETGN